jgi:hypothetical protein
MNGTVRRVRIDLDAGVRSPVAIEQEDCIFIDRKTGLRRRKVGGVAGDALRDAQVVDVAVEWPIGVAAVNVCADVDWVSRICRRVCGG